MPVFHTKTIESILDPVAQQVSRLVIIHEEGEAGHDMPDLSRPVQAVSTAVTNLVKVGHEMTSATDDSILRQDMPQALHKVNGAAKLLEEAAKLSRIDPMSKVARSKLIEGSRLILQGTSDVLLVFDEAEVRKICEDCKKVLDYLAVSEVIETLEDLVQFVKDMSPCLSKVTKEVEKRIEDLTHQVHREILARCVEQVKTLAPILICSMKIFIQIIIQGGKGSEEAGENRNYLANRMSEEVSEIIRVLQLTTYDEDEWDSDNLTVMKKNMGIIEAKLQGAHDWLQDPNALQGGVGEKSIRQILSHALKVADRSLPMDATHIRKLSGDIDSMTNALCELKQSGQGTSAQAESLAKNVEVRLNELLATVNQAINRVEKSGIQQPAPTVVGRLEQARRWLEQPGADDRDLGRQAIHLVVDEGYKIANVLPGPLKGHVTELCAAIEQDTTELTHLCREGRGSSARAMALSKKIAGNLENLKHAIETAIVDKVIDDFLDIGSPLAKFTEVVLTPKGEDVNRQFEEKANQLGQFSDRIVRTSKMVAVGTGNANKKAAEGILTVAGQVESLTPQLINAGRIRMVYPENKAADEHFNNLRSQYAELLQTERGLVDEVTDSKAFILRSLKAMKNHSNLCEDSIRAGNAIKLVENTSAIARMGNRIIQVAKQEADNSEDPEFISTVNYSANELSSRVAPMVHAAKALAVNMSSTEKANDWRGKNNLLLEAVEAVHEAVAATPSEEPPLPPYPDISDLSITDPIAPPRPPLPSDGGLQLQAPPARPPPPPALDTTDDESEDLFQNAPTASQGPIMMAAHDLHQEVKQWSSKDNDIISAAKKMALLMAKLSQLVGEDANSKRELISCAKAIAEASAEVTRIAKELAFECTDKRMRTTLMQVCERIPTIATQLKILSTVKATMLGAQGTEEDREATEMLVGNAQNLMQSVKQTVTAAEAASIKIRTEAGIRLKWVRKQPWYIY